MKTFWIILVLLAALTVVVCTFNRRSSDRIALDQPAESTGPTRIAPVQTQPEINGTSPWGTVAPATLPVTVAQASAAVATAPVAVAPATSPSTASAADDPVEALVDDLVGSFDAGSTSEDDDLKSELGPGLPPPTTSPDAPMKPRIQHRPDGSLLLDDQFVVTGSGTEKDPYLVSWELLVSAQESYVPRLDMLEMPARISFLNGKHVRITGYIFTPRYRGGITELLVMRNMWDGCCIGVPPSSYDSIDVTLKSPVTADDLAMSDQGTLDGVLTVDPFVKDNWLISLYVVQSGTLHFRDM